MHQVDFRKELLNQLLAELPLHERVGCDLADVAAPAVGFPLLDRQFPETLSERHAERVLPMAGAVQASISFVLRFVLYGDVRRVAHDDVIALAQDLVDSLAVLNGIDRLHLKQFALLWQRLPFTS